MEVEKRKNKRVMREEEESERVKNKRLKGVEEEDGSDGVPTEENQLSARMKQGLSVESP